MSAGVFDAVVGLSREPVSSSPDSNDIMTDAPVRTLLTGEILFQEGDPKAHLHQILAGSICVYRARIDRPHEVIEFAFSGDVLGLGYLEHQIYWARALIETRVRCLPLSALDNVLKCDQRAERRHKEALNREFEYRRNLLVTASNRQQPIGRLAAFLLVVSEVNTNEGRDPNIITDTLKCGVVAEWLGLDVETLSLALVELEKKGLIEPCAAGGLRLKDVKGLEGLADKTVRWSSKAWSSQNLGSETRVEHGLAFSQQPRFIASRF